jgi:hypothetical protein
MDNPPIKPANNYSHFSVSFDHELCYISGGQKKKNDAHHAQSDKEKADATTINNRRFIRMAP